MDEIAQLRQRLEEAEEICRALRAGEVDAVVVGAGQDDGRVLLMSGAYTRYRQVVEDMAQGAVTVSLTGEILFANRSFARMVGAAVYELFRAPLSDFIAENDGHKLAAILSSQPRVGEVQVGLIDAQKKSTPVLLSFVGASDDFVTVLVSNLETRQLYEEARATIEAIENGTVDAFVVGGDRVVTLESIQAPYRQLVERMHDGAAIVEADGVITFANERLAGMLDTLHPLVLGQKLQRFLAERDRAEFERMVAAPQGGASELVLSLPRGKTLSTHATVTPADGKHLVLFSDTTLRKRHAASEERTRKFLGMLAQEFGNILGPIRTSAALLLAASTDDASRKAAETIARHTERMAALVEDLQRINPED
jgi:PAS domain-containing protein